MKPSPQHFSLITSAPSLLFCTSHSLQLPLHWSFLYLTFSKPSLFFQSFLSFLFFIPIRLLLPSVTSLPFLLSLSLSLSFMSSSLPLHVGCVICKCADSCSRSLTFDSAVGVINSSANCDSSQTRLRQPISTLCLSSFPLWPPLCGSPEHTLFDIYRDTYWDTCTPIWPWNVWGHVPVAGCCIVSLPSLVLGPPSSFPCCHLPPHLPPPLLPLFVYTLQ